MKTIKTVKEGSSIIMSEEIGGSTFYTRWKPYVVGNLPKNFGCIDYETEVEGINEWFNFRGYTYVRD